MHNKWKVCTIDELGEINRGKSKHRPRNDSILFGGEYPFIQTGDVKKANLYITEYSETYNEVGLAQSKLWEKGTLCITIAANIAETAILGIDACFPDSVVGFIPYSNISDTKYVKYMMDMFKVYMQQISKGTTQDNLSLAKIRKVKFEAPNYPLQCKIANILSAYDNLIENNSKRIKILEQMAENLYKEWFVRFRFPGYENVVFEHGIPKGWEVKKIKNAVKRLPFNRTYKQNELEKTGSVIVVDQSSNEFLGFHDNDPDHVADLINPIILFGDHSCKFMILTKCFSLGENVIPFISDNKSLFNEYYLFFATKRLISTEEYKRHWGRLSSMKIFQADISTQNRFADIIKTYHSQKENLWNQNQNLIKQRDLLLPRLMSDKLEVK